MKHHCNSHKLVLLTLHSSGDEDWYCPTCEEHYLLKMPLRHLDHWQARLDLKIGFNTMARNGSNVRFRQVIEKKVEDRQARTGCLDDPYLEPWNNYLFNRGKHT